MFEVNSDALNGKSILITGGTGSFGSKCIETLLLKYTPRKVIVYSRDEFKQSELAKKFPDTEYGCMRYFIGDVRDLDRLNSVMKDVDYVIHAAAMKQIPSCESNPYETIKTNIIGSHNVITSAIANGVRKVVALSTDKAANPINLYGATKLCSDKLFIAANPAGQGRTLLSIVRYGNVLGSRGSVIPLFKEQKKDGVVTITDKRMTRFWITLEQGVSFVLWCLDHMYGGETFIPKIPSMSIMDLKEAICPECSIKEIGVRPGEKLHEIMIPGEISDDVLEFDNFYVVLPSLRSWYGTVMYGGKLVGKGFEYSSYTNPWKLSIDEMRRYIIDDSE